MSHLVYRVKRGEIIEYEMQEGFECMTPCPHKMKETMFIRFGTKVFIFVGSNACSGCKHCVYIDDRDKFVICFHKEDNDANTRRN